MTPFVDSTTGEIYTGCPHCERTRVDAEAQIVLMERERRVDRAARSRAEKAVEHAAVTRRDGKTWKDAIAYWQAAFPDRRISSKGIKSARATRYFQRLEAGATPEDIRFAIDAAKTWRYVVFGKRRVSGSGSDLAIDLQEIVSVGNDAQFDSLVEFGRQGTSGSGLGW